MTKIFEVAELAASELDLVAGGSRYGIVGAGRQEEEEGSTGG
ncbi:MAG TPA: hypothetical protein VNT25_01965 [Allosphingosinicella sp.]|nr:hypothetical protein [Allosphingosinicella sp.]